MRYSRLLALALLLLVCSAPDGSASYFQTTASKMDVMFKAEGPVGWQRLNASQPRFAVAEVVPWSAKRYAQLSEVQKRVNREVSYLPEAHNDVWRVAYEIGDCEDFALRYRQELLQKGWPAGALRLAVALSIDGTPHALLTIETTAGTWVMDSLYDGIRPWTAYPYRWLIREGPAGSWFVIRRQASR